MSSNALFIGVFIGVIAYFVINNLFNITSLNIASDGSKGFSLAFGQALLPALIGAGLYLLMGRGARKAAAMVLIGAVAGGTVAAYLMLPEEKKG